MDWSTVIGCWTRWRRTGDSWVASRYAVAEDEQLVTGPAAVLTRVRDAAGLPVQGSQGQVDDTVRVATSPTAKPDPNVPLHQAHVGMWRRWASYLPSPFDAIEQEGLLTPDDLDR